MNNIVEKDNDPTIVKLPGFEYSITLKTSLNQLPFTDPICFYTLFFSLDINNIVQLLSYMIQEQKILFYSSNVSTIEFCCEALISLLYPFYWQHVYIPIVPLISLDYLNLPLPSLLGICTDALSSPICAQIMSSRVVVNLDRNTVISPISISEGDSSTGMIKLPHSIESYFINQFNKMLYMNEMLVSGQNRTNDPTTINWINNIRIVSQSGFYPLLSPIMPMINEVQTADPEILVEKGILNKIPKEFINFMKSFLETQMFQSFLQDYIDNDPSLQLFIFGLKEYNNNKHKIDPVVKILCEHIQEPVIINQKYTDNNNKEKENNKKHKLNIPTPLTQSLALIKDNKKMVNQFPFFNDKLLQVNGRMRSSSTHSNGAMTLTRNSIGWHAVDFDINSLDLYYTGNSDKDKRKSSLKVTIKNRSQSVTEDDIFDGNEEYSNNIRNNHNKELLDIISELQTPDSNLNSSNGGGVDGIESTRTITTKSIETDKEEEEENVKEINNKIKNKPLLTVKITHSNSDKDLPSLSNNNPGKYNIIYSNGILSNDSPYNLLRNPSATLGRKDTRRNTISIMSGINENDTIESIASKLDGDNTNHKSSIRQIEPIKENFEDNVKINEISLPTVCTDDTKPIPNTHSLVINESCKELPSEDSERESDYQKLPQIKTPPLDRRLVDDLTKNSDYETRIKSMDLSSSMNGDRRRPFAKLRKNIWSSMKSDLERKSDLSQSVNLPVQHPNN